MRSRSNWNLEVLVFEEREKPEYPEKNLSEQGREPTTNSAHIWRRRRDLNPGHIGGTRVLSPLRHPCSPSLISLYISQNLVVFFSSFRVGSRIMNIKVKPRQEQEFEIPVKLTFWRTKVQFQHDAFSCS